MPYLLSLHWNFIRSALLLLSTAILPPRPRSCNLATMKIRFPIASKGNPIAPIAWLLASCGCSKRFSSRSCSLPPAMLLFVALKIAPEKIEANVPWKEQKPRALRFLRCWSSHKSTPHWIFSAPDFQRIMVVQSAKLPTLPSHLCLCSTFSNPRTKCDSGLKPTVEQISYASRYALSRKQRSFCATVEYRGLWLWSR